MARPQFQRPAISQVHGQGNAGTGFHDAAQHPALPGEPPGPWKNHEKNDGKPMVEHQTIHKIDEFPWKTPKIKKERSNWRFFGFKKNELPRGCYTHLIHGDSTSKWWTVILYDWMNLSTEWNILWYSEMYQRYCNGCTERKNT